MGEQTSLKSAEVMKTFKSAIGICLPPNLFCGQFSNFNFVAIFCSEMHEVEVDTLVMQSRVVSVWRT